MKIALQPNLRVLDPKIASEPRQSPSTITDLAMHFPSLVPKNQLNNFDDQWRYFRLSASELTIPTENIPKYWNQINEIKDELPYFPVYKRPFFVHNFHFKNRGSLIHGSKSFDY